jgi:hypothetical protein
MSLARMTLRHSPSARDTKLSSRVINSRHYLLIEYYTILFFNILIKIVHAYAFKEYSQFAIFKRFGKQ